MVAILVTIMHQSYYAKQQLNGGGMARKTALPVTIVTACYNSSGAVSTMLASIPTGVPVILVDNASDDRTTIAALAQRHGAKHLQSSCNMGFGAACNWGARHADTEFVLFLNPDVTLTQHALHDLVAAARRYPHASAFNPRIAASCGTPTFKRRSHLIPRGKIMQRGWPPHDQEVNVLHGAALMVRRAPFESIGGFDPAIFLYHEDDDLSVRMQASCGPLMFIRDALVLHVGGASCGSSIATTVAKAWHMGRSRVYVREKHGRAAPFAGSVASAMAQLMSPVALLSTRKRAKQLAYLRGILSTRAHFQPSTAGKSAAAGSQLLAGHPDAD